MSCWRWAAMAVVIGCVSGCEQSWAPLQTPLPPDRMVARGLRLAMASADLSQAAETVRILAGKQIDFAAAPQTLPGKTLVLGGFASSLPLVAPQASWLDNGRLQWRVAVPPIDVALALGEPGQPACALHWQAAGAMVTLQAHVIAKTGAPDVALATAPQMDFEQPHLSDSEGCLEELPPEIASFVDSQVRYAVQSAVLPPLGGALVKALRTAIPPSLTTAVQMPLQAGTAAHAGTAESLTLRLQSSYLGGPTPQVERQGAFTVATLQAGMDVDRHACAVDVPPPQTPASVLLKPATVPASAPLLRRALVADAALLDHIGWAWARGGGFCRQGETIAATGLSSQWAAQLVPALAPWLDGGTPQFRLWPHASPQISLTEADGAPLLGWSLADATLEVIAQVGGVDAVVLSIRGRIHGQLRVHAAKGPALQFVHHRGGIDSAVVSSPLRADAAATPSAAALTQLVDAALQGMPGSAAVLPLTGLLPSGTVVTSVDRVGQDLWLWLDGGLQP